MIHVKIFGVTRLQTGISSFKSDAETVSELMKDIPGLSKKEGKDLIVMVNGRGVGRHYKFREGDEVVLLSPAGGG